MGTNHFAHFQRESSGLRTMIAENKRRECTQPRNVPKSSWFSEMD